MSTVGGRISPPEPAPLHFAAYLPRPGRSTKAPSAENIAVDEAKRSRCWLRHGFRAEGNRLVWLEIVSPPLVRSPSTLPVGRSPECAPQNGAFVQHDAGVLGRA